MVISLAFHPDDQGSIPRRSYFKFHKFIFLISNRDKKVISQSSQAMQHLNLLQIQEFGISELKVDPIVRAYTAMNFAGLAQKLKNAPHIWFPLVSNRMGHCTIGSHYGIDF